MARVAANPSIKLGSASSGTATSTSPDRWKTSAGVTRGTRGRSALARCRLVTETPYAATTRGPARRRAAPRTAPTRPVPITPTSSRAGRPEPSAWGVAPALSRSLIAAFSRVRSTVAGRSTIRLTRPRGVVGGRSGDLGSDVVGWPTWRMATQDALYGPAGFFRREVPADHFRTSVHASDLFAGAVEQLAAACGARTVVDLGAGRGELLTALLAREPSFGLVGVEVAARPAGLPEQIAWQAGLPDRVDDVLVLANEWLDDVPVDVVEVDDDGVPHILHVEPATGVERFGPIPSGRDAEWLARWWPLDGLEAGARAEIGHP